MHFHKEHPLLKNTAFLFVPFQYLFINITIFHHHGPILRLSILHFFLDDKNLNFLHPEEWVAKVWVAQWGAKRKDHWTRLPGFGGVTIHNSQYSDPGNNYWKTRQPVTDLRISRNTRFIWFCSVSALPVSSSWQSADRAAPVQCQDPHLAHGDEAAILVTQKMFQEMFVFERGQRMTI